MIRLSMREKDTLNILNVIPIKINQNILYCEQTKTEQERATGLMFRKFMAANRGMLFETFNRYKPIFHMKNCFIPLEAIFISPINEIIDIVPMIPLDVSSIYTTPKAVPVKYVIEVNRGYCSSRNIKIKDIVFVTNR